MRLSPSASNADVIASCGDSRRRVAIKRRSERAGALLSASNKIIAFWGPLGIGACRRGLEDLSLRTIQQDLSDGSEAGVVLARECVSDSLNNGMGTAIAVIWPASPRATVLASRLEQRDVIRHGLLT